MLPQISWYPLGGDPGPRMSNIKPIGLQHGGMSRVYKCDSSMHGGYVVVKVLSDSLQRTPGTAEQFARECYLWMLLGKHPNIVRVWSVHASLGEPPRLLMEFLPTSLREIISTGPVGVADAVAFAVWMADGLCHAINTLDGFCHADIKPENVLVSGDGVAKISDLGLARAVTSAVQTEANRHGGTSSTSAGPAGTPLYMAPEVIRGAPPTPAADAYAVGCVIHELITGEPVFGVPTGPADYKQRHLHQIPVSLAAKVASVPAVLAELVLSLLAKDSAQRPPVTELPARLRSIAQELGRQIPVAEPLPPDIFDLQSAASGLVQLGFNDDAIRAGRACVEAATRAGGDVGKDLARAARIVLARALRQSGRLRNAEAQLRLVAKPRQMDPVLQEAYYVEKGALAAERDDHAEALRMFQRAAAQRSESSAPWADMAISLWELGQADEAVTAMMRALAIATDLQFYIHLVPWLITLGRIEQALSVAGDGVTHHPASDMAYLMRALARIARYGEKADSRHPVKQLDKYSQAAIADLEKAARMGAPSEIVAMAREMHAAAGITDGKVDSTAESLSRQAQECIARAAWIMMDRILELDAHSQLEGSKPSFGFNRPSAATRELMKARTLCLEAMRRIPAGDRGSLAVVHNQLGTVHRHLDDVPSARYHLAEAIRLHSAAGDKLQAAQSQLEMAAFMQSQARSDEALRYARAAAEIFESSGSQASLEARKARQLIDTIVSTTVGRNVGDG